VIVLANRAYPRGEKKGGPRTWSDGRTCTKQEGGKKKVLRVALEKRPPLKGTRGKWLFNREKTLAPRQNPNRPCINTLLKEDRKSHKKDRKA